MHSKEELQEFQYHFPYHHLTHEMDGALYIFRHLFWGLEHYTYIKYVIAEIKKQQFKTIADIGCGEGRVLSELSDLPEDVDLYGFDISETAIKLARGFTQRPVFSTHDIVASPTEKTFDVVVSCEVIEHIKPSDVQAYCKNIANSLNENGQFFLTTPTTNVPVNKKHYQHFTKTLLESYLGEYFTIEDVAYLNHQNIGSKILSRLLANRFFISNFAPLNRWVLTYYKRHYFVVDEKTGSRIFIRARKK